jgi:hypothetical protein
MRLLTDSVHFVDGTAPGSWNTATVKREDGPQWDNYYSKTLTVVP